MALATAALAFPGVLGPVAPVIAGVPSCDGFSQTIAGTGSCLVTATATLYFTVAGGNGGFAESIDNELSGGHGARITGSIAVTADQTYSIVVGGNGADGTNVGGGGGGYSSIARVVEGVDVPVVIAGGGGGAGLDGAAGGSGMGAYPPESYGGGYGGAIAVGGSGSEGGSGGRLPSAGGGGDSVVGWQDGVPQYGYAGDGGYYPDAVNGGAADTGSEGGAGGGAFGGSPGAADGAGAAGATYGAGGSGGTTGGGGGGGYGGGGGGGGGDVSSDGLGDLHSGGGGGGGSSLVPSGAAVVLGDASGAIVSLSSTPPADTTPPTVSLNQASGQVDPTKLSPINFELTANEALDPTTVTSSDFTVTPTSATIGNPSCSGTPSICTIPVTPTAAGVVTISPADPGFSVADLAGNAQTNVGGWDRSVTYLIAPANDDFADATALTGARGSMSGTTVDAFVEGTIGLGTEGFWFPASDHSVWYTWTNTSRKAVLATFSGGDCNYQLTVMHNPAGPPGWYPNNVIIDSGNFDCTGTATLKFAAAVGETYTFRVAIDKNTGTPGPFTLRWTSGNLVTGSVAVSLTPSRGDITQCTLTVKGTNLMAEQSLSVRSYEGEDLPLIQKFDFVTASKHWSPAAQPVTAANWSVDSGHEIVVMPSTFQLSDGVSEVQPTFSNTCRS